MPSIPILRRDGELIGDNTDGVGLLTDLTQNLRLRLDVAAHPDARRRRRGARRDRAAAGAEAVDARDRQPHGRGAPSNWPTEFSDLGAVSGAAFDGVEPLEPFDLIINATSASLKGEVPPIPPAPSDRTTTCYDMAYGIGETPFTHWARDRGADQRGTGLGHAGRAGGRSVLRSGAACGPQTRARARSAARRGLRTWHAANTRS